MQLPSQPGLLSSTGGLHPLRQSSRPSGGFLLASLPHSHMRPAWDPCVFGFRFSVLTNPRCEERHSASVQRPPSLHGSAPATTLQPGACLTSPAPGCGPDLRAGPDSPRQTCKHEHLDFIIRDGGPEMIFLSCCIHSETRNNPHENNQEHVMVNRLIGD